MDHAADRHEPANSRRHRLGQLLDLAQNYRGWTRKQLSAELGRDPTKLIPGSGVPKLDVIIALAKTLDWTLDEHGIDEADKPTTARYNQYKLALDKLLGLTPGGKAKGRGTKAKKPMTVHPKKRFKKNTDIQFFIPRMIAIIKGRKYNPIRPPYIIEPNNMEH